MKKFFTDVFKALGIQIALLLVPILAITLALLMVWLSPYAIIFAVIVFMITPGFVLGYAIKREKKGDK